MNPMLAEIYRELCSRFFALEDHPRNEAKFLVLLDLISFIEENPDATVADYRELKDELLLSGPLPRPETRCIH